MISKMDDYKSNDNIKAVHIEDSKYKKKRMDRESELNKQRMHKGDSLSTTVPKTIRTELEFVPRDNNINSRTPSFYQKDLHPQSLLT